MSLRPAATTMSPIRKDLAGAIDRTWQRLSGPGTWWTGAHASLRTPPEAVVDVIYRLRTAAGQVGFPYDSVKVEFLLQAA